MKLRQKLKRVMAVVITICLVVSMMPNMDLTKVEAAGAISTDNNMNALSALGIDTSVLPDGYDAVSEENPYGKEKATISPVSELYIESTLSSARVRNLYGDNLPIGEQVTNPVGDFYSNGVINNNGGTTAYNAYRAASGDFTGSGLDGQVVTVAAKTQADSKGGIDIYFTNPKIQSTDVKSTKRILDADKIIGNKADDLYPNENFAVNSYQLQNYLQIITGDFDGNGIDDIAVYVPEQRNSRIEVYQLNTTTDNENDKNRWLDAANWVRTWTYSLKEAPYVSNMVSLTAGDMDGDGIDDLGITWGVYYGKDYKTKCQAVVLHGSGVTALQKTSIIDMAGIVRAAMTIGDADGDNKDELIIGGQLISDIDRNECDTRLLSLYEYDHSQDKFITSAATNMSIIEKDENGKLVTGEDGYYYSLPSCNTNIVCFKADGVGKKESIYLDSIVYRQDGDGFKIVKELDEDSSLQKRDGSNHILTYLEYGAIAGDFDGDGKETIMTIQHYFPYVTTVSVAEYWWIFRIGTRTYGVTTDAATYLNELNVSKTSSYVIKSFNVGSQLSYAFSTADTDNDTTLIEYTGKHYLTYTDPTVLSVLASPPYFADLNHLDGGDSYIGNSSTTYGVTKGSSSSQTSSNTISVGAYVAFEYEFTVFGVKVGNAEAEIEYTHGWTWETEKSRSVTQTVEYGTFGGQDTVAFYSVPMEIYEYIAYIPQVDENGVITGYNKQTMTVNIPYTAVVKTLAVSDYDAIAEDYEELPIIGENVLKHTVGEPATYPTTTAGLKDVNLPDGDYMGVAFGDGFITQSLEIEESKSSGYSNTNAVNVKAGGGPGSVTVGVTAGYENGFGTIKTNTAGKSFTGTVVNMPMKASGYGYNYSWKIMQYTYEGKQTFPVVSYIVTDVKQPASLPSNFEMDVDKTTDTSVTLTWDSTEKSIAGYQIYRSYNFPDGSGDYPVGDVISSDQFVTTAQKDGKTVYYYSFTDDNLNPYTEYKYKIQAINGIAPYESVLSDILTARTKPTQGQPMLTLSTNDLLIYPDKDASVKITVTNNAEHVQKPLYQWQKQVNGTWNNLETELSDTLTFSNSGAADAGEYRCRVNQMVGEYAITTMSDVVEVDYEKRSVTMQLDISQLSGDVMNPELKATLTNTHTDSGSVPTGTVTFVIRGEGYEKSYTSEVINGVATYSNWAAITKGIYEVTAYFNGSRIFKTVTSESMNYLAGVDSGYTLEALESSIVYGDQFTPAVAKYIDTGTDGIANSKEVDNTADYTLYFAANYVNYPELVKNYTNLDDNNFKDILNNIFIGYKNQAYLTHWIPVTTQYFGINAVNGDTITPIRTGTYRLVATDNSKTLYSVSKEFTVTQRKIGIIAPSSSMTTVDAKQPTGDNLQFVNSLDSTKPALVLDDTVSELGISVQCINTAGKVVTLGTNCAPGKYVTKAYLAITQASRNAQENYNFTYIDGEYIISGNTYGVTGTTIPLLNEKVGSVHVISPEKHMEWSTKYSAYTSVIFEAVPEPGYSVDKWTVTGAKTENGVNYSKLNANVIACAMLSQDLDVKVSFKVSENTLNFAPDKTSNGTVVCSSSNLLKSGATVMKDSEYTFTAKAKTGYHFKEWWVVTSKGTTYDAGSTDALGNPTYTLKMPSTSCYLYAIFERDSYMLTLSDSLTASYLSDVDKNSATPDEVVLVKSGEMVKGDTVITVKPKSGYMVLSSPNYSWSSTPEQSGVIAPDGQAYTFVMIQSTSVSAKTQVQHYNITWNEDWGLEGLNKITVTVNGMVVDLAKGQALDVEGGSTVSIKAEPAYGVVFDQWVPDTTNESTYSTSGNILSIAELNGDVNVTAKFKENDKYIVSINKGIHGALRATINGKPVDVTGGILNVYKGDSVVFNAIPDDNYMVGTWSINGVVDRTTEKTRTLASIRSNTTVELGFLAMSYYTVKFADPAANGLLRVIKDGAIELSSGDKPGGGSIITFIVTPDSGYMVESWNVNGKVLQGELDNQYELSLSQDLEVGVSLIPIQTHTITISNSNKGNVTVVSGSAIGGLREYNCVGGKVSTTYIPDDFDDLSTDMVEVRDGAKAEFKVIPEDGYVINSVCIIGNNGVMNGFDHIDIQEDGSTIYTVLSMTDNLEVCVEFEKLYEVITKNTVGGTTQVSAAKCVSGTPITATAVPAINYVFDFWKVETETLGTEVVLSNVKNATIQFTMPDSNITLTPCFKYQSPIIVPSNPGDSGNSGSIPIVPPLVTDKPTPVITTSTDSTTGEITKISTYKNEDTNENIKLISKTDHAGTILSMSITITPRTVIKTDGDLAQISVSTPTELLNEALSSSSDSQIKASPILVDVVLPTDKLLEEINNSSISKIALNLTIPELLAENDKIPLNEIMVVKSVLQAAKDLGKDVTVSIKDETGKLIYNWNFTGDRLKASDNAAVDVNMALSISKVSDFEDVKELIQNSSNNKNPDGSANGVIIYFNHSGVLPSEATVKAYIGNQSGIVEGKKVYLYYYNKETKKLDVLPNNTYLIDKDGYIEIQVVHCSDYVILPQIASSKISNSLLNQVKVSTKYTLKKGNTNTIKVTLPSTLEKVTSLKQFDAIDPESAIGSVLITYKSSNNSIVAVNKNGKILAKGKGKATIITTSVFSDGTKKNYKTIITVK